MWSLILSILITIAVIVAIVSIVGLAGIGLYCLMVVTWFLLAAIWQITYFFICYSFLEFSTEAEDFYYDCPRWLSIPLKVISSALAIAMLVLDVTLIVIFCKYALFPLCTWTWQACWFPPLPGSGPKPGDKFYLIQYGIL